MNNEPIKAPRPSREAWLYLIFGALTTLVNFIVFRSLELALGERLYLLANAIAWAAAVAFAYATNKLIVFRAHAKSPRALLLELLEFIGARLLSLGIEELGLLLLIDVCGFRSISIGIISGSLIAKLILAVIVVTVNYVLSKLIIFKK